MSSSRPDTAATNRDVDSEGNRNEFISAREATTYDDLLLDGRISNADVRDGFGSRSDLHVIPIIGSYNKDIDTDILLFYLLTWDPPADVNGRDRCGTPMRENTCHPAPFPPMLFAIPIPSGSEAIPFLESFFCSTEYLLSICTVQCQATQTT